MVMVKTFRTPKSGRARCAGLALPVLVALAASGALAQQPGDGAAGGSASVNSAPVVAEFPPDREVCYGREYGREHLAAHPRQKVTAFHLVRFLRMDPDSEREPRTREQIVSENVKREAESRDSGDPSGATSIEAYVRFRDRAGTFQADLSCHAASNDAAGRNGFVCGVECDGGSFSAHRSGDRLIVKQSADSGGLRVQSGCSAEDETAPPVFVDPAADALEFHLDPQPIESCERARAAHRPRWVADGRPLRERFAVRARTCHRRVYDPAHLNAHPRQRVASVALETSAPARETSAGDAPAEGGRSFRIRFVMRNGTTVDRRGQCSPLSYAFDCVAEGEADAGFRLIRAASGSVILGEASHEEGSIARLLGVAKAEDDHSFRLDETAEAACP